MVVLVLGPGGFLFKTESCRKFGISETLGVLTKFTSGTYVIFERIEIHPILLPASQVCCLDRYIFQPTM